VSPNFVTRNSLGRCVLILCFIRCGPDEQRILDVVPRRDGACNSGQDGESGRPHTHPIIPKQNILGVLLCKSIE